MEAQINEKSHHRLVTAIQQCAEGFDFSNILSRLKIEYTFRNITPHVEEISSSGNLNSFLIVCYKLVIFKIVISSMQQQKEQNKNLQLKQLFNQLNHLSSKLSSAIKQQYCVALQKIGTKKSETIQFVLFIICFSTKFALRIIYKNYDILREYLLEEVQSPGEGLQILACMIVNFQITGIKLTANSYLALKKKYCIKINNKLKQKKFSTELISNLMQFFPTQKKYVSEKSPDICNQKHPMDEFKVLFSQESNKQNYQSKSIVKKANISHQDRIFSGCEDSQIKIFRSSGLNIRSEAFNKNRMKNQFTKKYQLLSRSSPNSCRKQYKNSLVAQAHKKQKQKQKRDITMAIISQSLAFYFAKSDKKNVARQSSKLNVNWWNKKIKCMQQQGNLQKATLKKAGQKWRKTQHSQQQLEKNFQSLRSSVSKTTRYQEVISNQKSNPLRQGFCEFIDQRQPKQMGIVKGVVNYTASGKQIKHKKASSRQMKLQFEQFNRKIIQHKQRSLNQNNFVFRLQKALTGTNKI